MHDPEFEKGVRQKMEELKFAPSESLWTNVEKELNKSRKRKKPLLWLFLFFGIAVAGSIYWLNTGKEHRANGGSKQEMKTASNTGSAEDIRQSAKKAATANTVSRQDEKNSGPGTGSGPSFQLAMKKTTATSAHPLIRSAEKINAEQPAAQHENSIDDKSLSKMQEPGNSKNKNAMAGLPPDNGPIKDNDETAQSKKASGKTGPAASLAMTGNETDTKTSPPVLKQPAGSREKAFAENKKTKNRRPWKIGFTAGGGMSEIYENLFTKTVVPGSVNYSYNLSTASFAPPGLVSFAAAHYKPANIRPGFSFSAGALLDKQVGKKIFFSAGLNYHYYSTLINTGKKITSDLPTLALTSTNGYYLNDGGHSYTNHYHFIEIPVSLLYQFTRSKKLPLFWELGLSLSQLIASDGLHFDNLSTVYYKDNSLFNKTQLGAGTAILVGFHEKNNMFRIGPEIQYGFSNLLSASAGSQQHLFFAGIKMVFIPNKK